MSSTVSRYRIKSQTHPINKSLVRFVVCDLGASPSIIAEFLYRSDAELFVSAKEARRAERLSEE